MIIGTAGHIDHGKSALVRALTGVDTDRLPEEKARGISIELGYAYQQLPGGPVLGFVDVPGHERFVHTMVAGASGIRWALLVVAADDGVMPQTREHLAILDLLGVQGGTVAITKTDRVEPIQALRVEQQVRQLLGDSRLAGANIHHVSAPTGRGIPELREELAAVAAAQDAAVAMAVRARPSPVSEGASAGRFRLAIDRSFVLDGVGIVAAGTVFSGQVAVGDSVAVAPGGHAARVRSLHVHNRPAAVARAGERCALQLAGIAREQAPRGAWLVEAAGVTATRRFDVRLRLLAGTARALRHWAPVQVHLGACHANAHVALLDANSLQPGTSALAQVVTDQPLACWHGDAFVIRDPAARHTLGGGRVLDPDGWVRHRASPPRLAVLAALERPGIAARLQALLEASPGGVDLQRLARALPFDPGPGLDHLPGLRRIRTARCDVAFAAGHWQALRDEVLARLAAFHGAQPEDAGPDLARLRRMSAPLVETDVFRAALDELQAQDLLERSGPHFHLPGHRPVLDAAEQRLADRLLPLLEQGAFDPPWVRELAAATGAPEASVRRTLQRLAQLGELFQVVRDLFYTPASIRRLCELCAQLQGESPGVAAARFRDASGLGRKRAIQILEFFDGIGYTRRVRNLHRVRQDSMFARPAPAGSPADTPGFRQDSDAGRAQDGRQEG